MPAELPLFAYGTLLTGALDPAIDRLLARDAMSLGPARLRGWLHDQGGYPGLVLADGGPVRGELLAFGDLAGALALLDRYEAFDPRRPHAGEYIRAVGQVDAGGAPTDAWVYLLNVRRVRPGPRIVGGDWRRYLHRRIHKMSG